MAKRPAWTVSDNKVTYQSFSFEWNAGFSISQKQKNIKNLHRIIGQPTLEVSTKSLNPIGVSLSAFNLKLDGNTLENVFQASKVYEEGGPYLDLLNVAPKVAKCDERHKMSGKLIGFLYKDNMWTLLPKTAFYDYIYCKAVMQSEIDLSVLDGFEFFTDIEFNPNKSINCQAKSLAVLKLLIKNNDVKLLEDIKSWIKFHEESVIN